MINVRFWNPKFSQHIDYTLLEMPDGEDRYPCEFDGLSIMQTDNDGEEIFVNDFIELSYNTYGTLLDGELIEVFLGGDIEFERKEVILVTDHKYVLPLLLGINGKKPVIKIIGNARQNPELIKKTGKVEKIKF